MILKMVFLLEHSRILKILGLWALIGMGYGHCIVRQIGPNWATNCHFEPIHNAKEIDAKMWEFKLAKAPVHKKIKCKSSADGHIVWVWWKLGQWS